MTQPAGWRQVHIHKALAVGVAALACLLIQFAVAPAPGLAADKIPSDQRLPAETLLYVALHDTADLKDRWDKTTLGRLLRDDALKPFLEQVQKQIETASKEVEEELGVGLSKLAGIPSGELSLAVVSRPGEGLSLVLFLDYGEDVAPLQALLDKASKRMEDRGWTRSEEDVDGTNLVTYEEKKNAGEGRAKPLSKTDATVYFLKDSHFVAATDAEILKAVLARWDGKHEQTLAGAETYRYMLQVCRDPDREQRPLFTWFVDPMGFFNAAVFDSPSALFDPDQAAPQAALLKGMIPMFGVDKIKGIGGTLDLAVGDFDTVNRTLIYLDPQPTGLLNMFQFPAAPLAPPSWVSAQAVSYFSLNWDLEKAYAAVETLYDSFQGPGALEKIFTNAASLEPGINWKKDFYDQLTGKFHVMADVPNAEDSASERLLFAAEIKDAKVLQNTLSALSKFKKLGLEGRLFRGQPVYEIPLEEDEEEAEKSDPDEESQDDPPPKGKEPEGAPGESSNLGIAVAQGHLLIAYPVTLLEDVLRADPDQESLAASGVYQKIARQFPQQTSSINFQRQSLQLRAVYEALKTVEEGDGVDFSTLPKFEIIQRYLGPSGSYMRPDERGLLIHGFSLPGEQQ